MIKIRGIEYDFSFTDIEHVQRLREAINTTDESAKEKFADANKIYAELDETDIMGAFDTYIKILTEACKLYADLIDDVLGEDTANKALGKTTDIAALTEFWVEFQEALNADAERFGNKINGIKPYGKKGKK